MLISKFCNDSIESVIQKIEIHYNFFFPVEYSIFTKVQWGKNA